MEHINFTCIDTQKASALKCYNRINVLIIIICIANEFNFPQISRLRIGGSSNWVSNNSFKPFKLSENYLLFDLVKWLMYVTYFDGYKFSIIVFGDTHNRFLEYQNAHQLMKLIFSEKFIQDVEYWDDILSGHVKHSASIVLGQI